MRTYEEWMNAYSVDHQNTRNQIIHKFCVPLIMFSIIGILWALPRPQVGNIEFNWAVLLIVFAILFYASLRKWKMFLFMTLQTTIMVLVSDYLYSKTLLMPISIGIFIAAWIGQFIGHKIEGRKPSFLDDLSFLLIGPLWVNRFLFKKLGIKE